MEFGNGKKNQLVWRSSENRYHNEEFKVNEDNDNVNVEMHRKNINIIRYSAQILKRLIIRMKDLQN